MKSFLLTLFAMLLACGATAIAQTACYYDGKAYSENAKHQPSIPPSPSSKEHKAGANLTCTPTGDFSEGASYSSDGSSCQQCGSGNTWHDVDVDSCRKVQVCNSPPRWMDAVPDTKSRDSK
jgi:hypothetical protein